MIRKESFINEELLTEDSISLNQLSRSTNRGFGVLGTGILRPPKRILKQGQEKDIVLKTNEDSLFLLANQDSTAKLSQQIANSIQNRIDKAALAEEQKQKEEVELSQKSDSSLLVVAAILGSILITGIVIYAYKKNKASKLKTT